MRVRFFECSILFCLSVGKDEECTSGAASLLNISNFGAVHSQKEILMDKQNLRILFMGTPDFAVVSLKALVEGGYCVVGVVTMPDKPMGRHGSVLQASPVKQYAAAQGLRVLQPERLSDSAFVDKLRKLDADLQIVVAFRMLPRVVWEMPRLGTFNLHASLLPQYRGAAPINWAVIHGDKETGVTTFFLRHEIDTGRIILQRRVPIAETDDADRAAVPLCRLTRETDLVGLPMNRHHRPDDIRQGRGRRGARLCLGERQQSAERLSPRPALCEGAMEGEYPRTYRHGA